MIRNLDISELKKLSNILIIISLIVLNPVIVNSAEILQIKSSNTILVGDQNRNLTIGLFCVDVNENDELEATNLLKSEFQSCLLYTSPSPRDLAVSRMPSSA